MPIYSYKCEVCGKIEDAMRKIDKRHNSPECHGPMKQIITNYHVIGDLEPYVDENLGDKPVVVKSKKHRERLMRENGVYEKIGKGWI